MEDCGYKYVHKLPQFKTSLNSRRNISIDMRPNTVKNCDPSAKASEKFYFSVRNFHSSHFSYRNLKCCFDLPAETYSS